MRTGGAFGLYTEQIPHHPLAPLAASMYHLHQLRRLPPSHLPLMHSFKQYQPPQHAVIIPRPLLSKQAFKAVQLSCPSMKDALFWRWRTNSPPKKMSSAECPQKNANTTQFVACMPDCICHFLLSTLTSSFSAAQGHDRGLLAATARLSLVHEPHHIPGRYSHNFFNVGDHIFIQWEASFDYHCCIQGTSHLILESLLLTQLAGRQGT
jgi:hypothetical protein